MDKTDILAAMFAAAASDNSDCECDKCKDRRGTASLSHEVRVQRVLDHYADFAKRYDFKPGDLVTVKPGFEWYTAPKPGEACVVVAMLETPIIGERDGTQFHGARQDMRILCISDRGVPVVHLVVSEIFMPYTKDAN